MTDTRLLRPELLSVSEVRCYRWAPRIVFACAVSNAYFSGHWLLAALGLIVGALMHFVAQFVADERKRHGLPE